MLHLEVYDINIKHIAGGEKKNIRNFKFMKEKKKEWKNKRCN
jgi:hypothetical protein